MSEKKKQQPSPQNVQTLLEQEIAISQEILSQLSQQEYLLLIGEVDMKNQLQEPIQTLAKQKQALVKKRKALTLNAPTLDPLDAKDAETLLLLDKSNLLNQKIEDQKNKNASLTQLIQNEQPLDPRMLNDGKVSKPSLLILDHNQED